MLIHGICFHFQAWGVESDAISFSDKHSVKTITMQNGLSHNFIEDLYRDSKGYVWIATSGSLARYDGYEFVNFTPNTLDRYIKSSFVRKMSEDRFGRLWVASDGGIDVISLKNLTPVQMTDPEGKLSKLSFEPASYVSTDSAGNIWLRNYTDIICISFNEDGSLSKVLSMPHHTNATVLTGAVKPLADGSVWSGIGGNVCRLSVDKGNIVCNPVSPYLNFDSSVYISDFVQIGNDIWISTDIGLFRYDLATGSIRDYVANPGQTGALSQTFVTSLAVTGKGELIAGCLNGMNVYDKEEDAFVYIKLSDQGIGMPNLSSNFINCLLVEDDNLWVGTEGGGVTLFTPRRLYSKMWRHDSSDRFSLSPNPVNAIYEDGDGTLWVGTVEGGLNRASCCYEGGFEHFTKETGTLTHNSVSAITSDHTGHLWVGTWGGGLCMLDRHSPSRPLLTIREYYEGGYNLDYIGALAFDPFNNYLWIGANCGIFTYDINTGRLFIPFPKATELRGSVGCLIAHDGSLWIGGLDGIAVVDLKGGYGKNGFRYVHLENKLDDPESIVKEKISAISHTNDGTIWIGTNGNGIYRYDDKGGERKFVNYNSSDGLPNDVVQGIAEDTEGNLWIATYHGLSCMTPDGRFVNFGINNGLETEQFYWNAYRRLANGDILFGSVDGMLAVKGLASSRINRSYPVRFTSLTVDRDKTYGNPEKANIPENERSFEIEFSAFDYAGGDNGRFYYRMAGYEKDWKELPAGRHSVAYMNLFPGNYSLEVKYVAEGQSLATAPVSCFEVEIVPNFYRRWWFLLIIAVIMLSIIWFIYRWRVKDLKRQRNELQVAVADGVKEISEQKALIEEHARELGEQNTQLIAQNKQISEQKTQLAEMAGQVQKLTADRISFFTNITHEFRTPITLIIGPIERALKLSTNPKVIEQLNFVERNSRFLLSLINQLMDFRKIESGKMEVTTTRGDISKLINDILLPFRPYADERGIELRTVYHLTTPVFDFNEDAMRKVLTNLLGNAVKFTPDNGKVTVYASVCKRSDCSEGKVFYLCVSDTGCGLNEDDADKVFDHFYQGKSQIKYPLIGASDSGIGLYLCRRLVEVYGGKISAKNNHGAGCSFRVIIPLDKAYESLSEDKVVERDIIPAEGNTEESQVDKRMTLLVVEDNVDMRAFMRSVLSDRFTVLEASDGQEALKILLSRDVDFIISDLMMPVMDGLELAEKVKGNFAISHIPFVMLTAKTSRESRMEGYRKGVDDYILKPFDEDMLLTRINNILENKKRYQRKFITDMDVEQLEINEESRDKKFVNKVMEVLKENYTNSYFEVGEFAEALGVSRSLLNKKLQSLMGQSANQLVRTYRLKRAHELILLNRTTKNLNVSEIAFQVGFNDSKYFTRCFTKHFGVNPSVVLKGGTEN